MLTHVCFWSGVVQEEYDRLLGRICEEVSFGDIWLTFPEGGRDAVEITSNDMHSVQPGGSLSGNIIDFYIKWASLSILLLHSRTSGFIFCIIHALLPDRRYLWKGLSSYMNKDHLHFFNNFFFTQLADNGGASTESAQRKAAFAKVQKWAGEVNIFEKAYVFIPVYQR